MSASLVGSEMCIRDRATAGWSSRCSRSDAYSGSPPGPVPVGGAGRGLWTWTSLPHSPPPIWTVVFEEAAPALWRLAQAADVEGLRHARAA
eukprot:3224685-Alexandrium_andersonii.AAC.1